MFFVSTDSLMTLWKFQKKAKNDDYLKDFAKSVEFDDLLLDYIATLRPRLSWVLSILHKCWLYVKRHPKDFDTVGF